MHIKLIGLGKMGLNIALNLMDHGHDVTGYARSQTTVKNATSHGIKVASSYEELLQREDKNRLVVWLLVPSNTVDQVIEQVLPFLKKGDLIIDGGNSRFNLSMIRYELLKEQGVDFIDLGTSGGQNGARNGACLMAGGEKDVVESMAEVFKQIAVKDGFMYIGKPGSGHFVKMVHNGIEYGMMQAIGEGFGFLRQSNFDLDLAGLANLWNHGSIIESLLVKNISDALQKSPELSDIKGIIDDNGEGMWMIEEALKSKVSLPVITQALFTRYKSRDEEKFSEKVVAAIRNEFGGHALHKK